MRKLLLATVSAALVGLMGVSDASADPIAGSGHDMHALLNGNAGPIPGSPTITVGTDEICIFCHTPHGATGNPAPLWWRLAPATVAWTMYDSPSLGMTPGAAPQGVSLACLSCHDGATALDNLVHIGSNTIENADLTKTLMGDWKPWMVIGDGGDLSTEHPVSFTYGDSVTAKPAEVVPQATVELAGLRFYGAGADQMECATCHAVHDPANVPFLRLDNAASALCLTCHIK